MTKFLKKTLARNLIGLLGGIVIIVLSTLDPAQAQQGSNVTRNQIARVEEINENIDLIVIGGEQFLFDRERIRVFYRGAAVDKYNLIPGLRVRFNIDNEGYVSDVNLLSPSNIIEMMMTD
jgi:hypothetical protein